MYLVRYFPIVGLRVSPVFWVLDIVVKCWTLVHRLIPRLTDMSCAGKHARIIGIEEGNNSTVYPFDESMTPSKEIRTVHVAYAYATCNGRTIILQVNHCLDFTTTMHHSILCTNQGRANNLIINDCPKALDIARTSTQSVILPDNNVELPILFHGLVP